MKVSTWDSFTNQYPLTKTLRFELKPVGKTLQKIQDRNLITEDEQRQKDFNKVKKIMDGYYKQFIEECLEGAKIPLKKLEENNNAYTKLKKDPYNKKLREEYAKLQKQLRKLIHDEINKKEEFKYLFKKEFIKKILPEWLEKKGKKEELKEIEKFDKWVTYFSGFFNNRKNVFSSDEISTSMIYRIVNDNLPKFLDDVSRFGEITRYKEFDANQIEENFESELNGEKLKDFFNLKNFNNCLNQEGIEKFNLIIGGKSEEGNNKIKGLNELVNELAQKQADKNEQKKVRKLKLAPLFKQILSDRKSSSFAFEKFEENTEVFDAIDEFYDKISLETLKKIEATLEKLEEKDLELVYLKNDRCLTGISQEVFGDRERVLQALREYAKTELGLKTDKKIEKWMKKGRYSIHEIESGLKKIGSTGHPICNYFSKLEEKKTNLIQEIKKARTEYEKISDKKKKLTAESQEPNVARIKALLDSIMRLYHFIKPLNINFKNKKEKDSEALETDNDFYNDFDESFAELGNIIPLYNQVRNYVTQKPFSTEKFKLNFENPKLLSGWDKNKEKDYYSVILRKEESYYLAIMTPKQKNVFDELERLPAGKNYFEKIDYKLLPTPEKNLPRILFAKKNISFYKPSKEIEAIRNHSAHTKHGNPQNGFKKRDFRLSDCHKMIDFYKKSIQKHPEWKEYDFQFKKTEDYVDISEFYKEVSDQGYKIEFKKISEKYLLDLVEEGKLYLFQIWNKDFSKYSEGRKNLHTIYWKELFSKENLSDITYKLNGEAEIFYRPKSMERKVTHPKNQKIENKDPIKGKKFSKFKYDFIKNKRYTEDRFFFHCPITLNFQARDGSKTINKRVNDHIRETKDDIFVLSIDRGERHLAYYTLLNSKGEIQEQGSFNVISDDKERKRDYHEKLDEREKERDKARKSWQKIETIKKLKDGYLSQIVHKIAKLAIEKNAIIVLEDLNLDFKRGRLKIEKQVYQKFEKKLIDKLNYLVFKERTEKEAGGSLNAYQLTGKFEGFKKLGKETGIIYYVPAAYTSKICPKTGFVNLLRPKFKNIEKAKEFFKKFNYIKYDSSEGLFEFNFDYSKFIKNGKKETKIIQDNWSVYSNGTKLVGFRNKNKNNSWDTKEVKPNEKLKILFKEYGVSFQKDENIISQIASQNKKAFFENLIKIFKTILMLRNSRKDPEEDYVLSCVKDENGEFFDSRKAKDNEPKDADANGAYHIGLKGLMLLERIKANKGKKKLDLLISRNDFINFAVERSK
jgi:CRISPR-associated protein Cpf1